MQNGAINYVSQQNSNNLVDRVVGDLTAAIAFGWAEASDTVHDRAIASGTESYLMDSVFSDTYSGGGTSLANSVISDLSPLEYFYLLSVLGINGEADGTSGANIAAFTGSAINPTNPLFYDNFGDAIVAYTAAYSYSDRLQGYSPDIFPVPGTGSPSDFNDQDQYIYLTLSPGGYTYTAVPEPSTVAFLLMAGSGLGAMALRPRPCEDQNI